MAPAANFNAMSPVCYPARFNPSPNGVRRFRHAFATLSPRSHTMMSLSLVPRAAAFTILLLLSAPSSAAVSVTPPPAAVSDPAQDAAATCVPVEAMTAPLLYGQWAVRYTNPPAGLPPTATLMLQRHAEFSESLAGTVTRSRTGTALAQTASAALAGDLDGGLLLLDESADRIRITAAWNGEMVPGSCGREFTGLWKDMTDTADNSPSVAFTLKKLP